MVLVGGSGGNGGGAVGWEGRLLSQSRPDTWVKSGRTATKNHLLNGIVTSHQPPSNNPPPNPHSTSFCLLLWRCRWWCWGGGLSHL